MSIHFLVPDTQVRPGVPTDHLGWVGQYFVDQFANKPDVKLIHLGDHADMSSLSSYDKGKRAMEGRRYTADIQSANDGFDLLCDPLEKLQAQQKRNHKHIWNPEKHFLIGNHEDRITRACEDDAVLDGALSLNDLNYAAHGFTVHDYLAVAKIDGILYSHYFINPASGRPLSGMIQTRVKNLGASFTQGHKQGLESAIVETVAGRRRGLIAGSCYLHNEEYRGPQATGEWRGVLVCHEVQNGSYDLMEVSLNFLCQKYEGKPLEQFMMTGVFR